MSGVYATGKKWRGGKSGEKDRGKRIGEGAGEMKQKYKRVWRIALNLLNAEGAEGRWSL